MTSRERGKRSSTGLGRPGSPQGGKAWPAIRPARLDARRRDQPLRLGLLPLVLAPLVLLGPGLPAARAADTAVLMRLLERKACPGCRLQDADLVLADLRDADLRKAQLQRANLSQAQLDGARLMGADLSFTSLQGASLRGADLRGARLEGTDLRQTDLSGALLDPGAIARSHWDQAQGLPAEALKIGRAHV